MKEQKIFSLESTCRVCQSKQVAPFETVDKKVYERCSCCKSTFLHFKYLPSISFEYERYKLHQNCSEDQRYRNFLSQVSVPLLTKLEPMQKGLDYGCGPAPTLSKMFEECGHSVSLYDPFFYKDETVFKTKYNFITCTEVAEHFHYPFQEFTKLNQLLLPNGWLAIMTSFLNNDSMFAGWHYTRNLCIFG